MVPLARLELEPPQIKPMLQLLDRPEQLILIHHERDPRKPGRRPFDPLFHPLHGHRPLRTRRHHIHPVHHPPAALLMDHHPHGVVPLLRIIHRGPIPHSMLAPHTRRERLIATRPNLARRHELTPRLLPHIPPQPVIHALGQQSLLLLQLRRRQPPRRRPSQRREVPVRTRPRRLPQLPLPAAPHPRIRQHREKAFGTLRRRRAERVPQVGLLPMTQLVAYHKVRQLPPRPRHLRRNHLQQAPRLRVDHPLRPELQPRAEQGVLFDQSRHRRPNQPRLLSIRRRDQPPHPPL